MIGGLLLGACGEPAALQAEDLPAPARRFVVGNEGRHDLFGEALAGRGGALLCVGGDHCYTLLALAGAEAAYLIDHDRRVIELHAELGARVIDAPDADELLAGLAAPPTQVSLAAAWPAVTDHLRRVAARPSTWLSDPVLYARSREAWRTGAVHPLLGDLAGDRAMASIARSARDRGLFFTAIYLSNAEETLVERGALRRNLAGLPRAPGSVLLRTFFLPDWPAADGLWSYQVHGVEHYLARAGDPPMDLAAIVADARARGELRVDREQPGLSTIATNASARGDDDHAGGPPR